MTTEVMNMSVTESDSVADVENHVTEEVKLSVDQQKVTFKAAPSPRPVKDVTMETPERKVLAEKRQAVDQTDDTDRPVGEPTFKRARLTREALRAAYSAPYFTAPVIWTAEAGSDGSALFLADNFIVVGTKDGRVIHLDLEGNTIKVQQLPLPAQSLVRDGSFLYAWCPAQYSFDKWKGALYDLTMEEPRFLFDVENIGEWLLYATMQGGMLVLGDDKGSLALMGANGEVVWYREATDGRGASRMLLADETSIYFGHKKKVIKYNLKDGEEQWSYEASGRHVTVHEGIQDDEHVFVEIGAKVVQLRKDDGSVTKEFTPLRHRASNVCVGSGYLITGSCPTILFDLESTEERYRMNFAGRLNDAFMKMHPNGRLFAVWDKIYCMDLRPEGVQRAVEGKSTRTRDIVVNTPATAAVGDERLSATSATDHGIRVECREDGDGVINVYPADTGFEATWTVRFPKALKSAGRKFLVDDLVAHEKYCFYSVLGEIRELVSPDQITEGDHNGNEAGVEDRSLEASSGGATQVEDN